MRALITGAEGFLGANLCRALLSQGHDVTALSLNRQKHTSLDALGVECRVEYGDVTDAQFVERVIASSEAEWVFHLAAVSIVRIAQASPALALRTNILGTLNVMEACRKLSSVKSIVCASSDKAYGDHGGKPYDETMPLLPVAPYEVSKAGGDLISQSYAATYGLNVKVTRCANLYGPGDLNWSRMVPNSCRRALSGMAPEVHQGTAHMQRDYLYVDDAVAAYIFLASNGKPGPYNVGTGCTIATIEIAQAISNILGAPDPVCEPKQQPFAEIPAQELNTDKINCLGWSPKVKIKDGLLETIEWYHNYLWEKIPCEC